MEEKAPSEKQELITDVVGFNFRKLWFTFRQLTFRPGETVADYCDGERKQYVSPITYFLLAYGIGFFITKLSGLMRYYYQDGRLVQSHQNDSFTRMFVTGYKLGNPTATDEHVQEIITWVTPGIEFISSKEGGLLIYLPITLLLQWLFYKAFRKSFYHNLYFLLYISAQVNLITIPIILILGWAPSMFGWLFLLFVGSTVAFYFYALPKFYTGIRVEQIVIRTLGQVIVGIAPLFLWFMILFITYTLVYNRFM